MSLDRACGALWGLAVGDALGMPTQSLDRPTIARRWGMITGFEPGPPDQPIAPGRAAGSVTDDTEQALLLGRLLADGAGHVPAGVWAAALTAWEDDMRRRGSLDLLGPSTRRAIAALRSGVPPEHAGAGGTTNGAAMRIAPVGILLTVRDLPALVDRVVEVSTPTHNTPVALAAAAAVAAAVSAGIDGADPVPVALSAARLIDAATATAIGTAVALVGDSGVGAFADVAALPTSVQAIESVPVAFAVLAMADGDPWRAGCLGASTGGDTDTIAAMAGAMAGAAAGTAALRGRAEIVGRANDLDVDGIAARLYALRR